MNPDLEKAIAAIRAQGGTDADVEAYVRSLGGRPVEDAEKGKRQAKAAMTARRMASENALDRARSRTYLDDLGAVAQSFADAGTFGAVGLLDDALTPGGFTANRNARRASREELPASARVAAGISGGLAAGLINPVSFLRASPASASLIARMGKGAAEGAIQGGVSQFGENVGATERYPGEMTDVVRTGAVAGGLLGGVVTPMAQRLADVGAKRFFDPLHPVVPDRLGGAAMRGRMVAESASDQAARNIEEGITADVAAGFRPPTPPRGPGFPEPMALDVQGPNVLSRARGATGTVAGREAMRGPLEARAARARAEVTQGTPDAPAIQQNLEAAREAQAGYEDVWEQTKGTPVLTPWLEDFINKTDIGKKAWEAAMRSRQTVVLDDPTRALPTVQRWNGPELVDSPVPDAEAVHLMKRYLGRLAGNEDAAVAEGFTADAAKKALSSFRNVREALPPVVRAADDRYAETSGLIDALQTGRTPWRPNPVNPRADIANVVRDINALPAQAGPASPRAMVNIGKQFDIASRIREGGEGVIPRMAEQARNPQSALAQELAVMGGDMPARLSAWSDVLERQGAVLPSGVVPTEPGAEGLLGAIAEVAGPSAPLIAARTGRKLIGRQSPRAQAARSRADEIVSELMTQTPEQFQAYLRRMRAMDAAQAKAGRGASRAAGIIGGLLGTADRP